MSSTNTPIPQFIRITKLITVFLDFYFITKSKNFPISLRDRD